MAKLDQSCLRLHLYISTSLPHAHVHNMSQLNQMRDLINFIQPTLEGWLASMRLFEKAYDRFA